MQLIRRETAVYAMSSGNAPVASAQSGETLVFETSDCFGGQIACEADRLGALKQIKNLLVFMKTFQAKQENKAGTLPKTILK